LRIIRELERALAEGRLQAAVLIACESFRRTIAESKFQEHGTIIAMEKLTLVSSALKFPEKLYKCMSEGMGFKEARGEAMGYARDWEARERSKHVPKLPMRGASDEFSPRKAAPTRYPPPSVPVPIGVPRVPSRTAGATATPTLRGQLSR
jgi:hypothetical protein